MTSSQTTKIPKEWEEHGQTTIPTTSEQRIGGAMVKRGQPELMTISIVTKELCEK
jgi:hypothetical protein